MSRFSTTHRERARALRGERGLSHREIASELGISPSTARRWTLDVRLNRGNADRITALRLAAAQRGSEAMASRYREKRRHWQLEGRRRAREGDLLHQAGCLLYGAEGSKQNGVTLVNSDVNMLRLFRRFLLQGYKVGVSDLTFRMNVYTGNGLSIPEIERYWLTALDLPVSCLRKHRVNNPPSPTSGVKVGKLPYGVGTLSVKRSTWLLQHIYGAIQEYAGFDEPRWLR